MNKVVILKNATSILTWQLALLSGCLLLFSYYAFSLRIFAFELILVYVSIMLYLLLLNGIVLNRDGFFLFGLVQILIYAFLMPTLAAQSTGQSNLSYYIYMQFLIFMFYCIPFIVGYKWYISNHAATLKKLRLGISISTKKSIYFSVFIIGFELVYLYLLFKHNMFYRRIGTTAAALLMSELDPLSLLIIRSQEVIALPLILFVFYIKEKYLQPDCHIANLLSLKLINVAHRLMILIYLTMAIINSRLYLLNFILLYLCILAAAGSKRKISFGKKGISLMLIVYLLAIISNVRVWILHNDSLINILNPLYFVSQQSNAAIENEWLKRLDCIDMMEKSRPEQNGYAWGEAWGVPVLIALGQFTFSSLVQEYKASATTTAKAYLLNQYMGSGYRDYQSCSLTDLYLNFNIYGFICGGIILALLIAFFTTKLYTPSSLSWIFIASVFLIHLLTFEQDYISYLVGWIKSVPIIIVTLFLLPFKLNQL